MTPTRLPAMPPLLPADRVWRYGPVLVCPDSDEWALPGHLTLAQATEALHRGRPDTRDDRVCDPEHAWVRPQTHHADCWDRHLEASAAVAAEFVDGDEYELRGHCECDPWDSYEGEPIVLATTTATAPGAIPITRVWTASG